MALLLLVGFSGLHARVVVSKNKQAEVLGIARAILGNAPKDSEETEASLKDPFHLKKKEIPVQEVVVEKAPEVEKVHELSESEILALVAKQLKPSGFIDQGGQQYLILNGKKVQDGVFFNFPHLDKRYAIEINQIHTNSFTLNLNSESKTISME